MKSNRRTRGYAIGTVVWLSTVGCCAFACQVQAAQSLIVALGASQTYGKGVSRAEAYPAQLEDLLRQQGYKVRVINAGINGDTTGGMLARLNRVVPKATTLVILQPGGNDRRKGVEENRSENISQIESALSARNIKTILLENTYFQGMPRGADGQHLTPEGYHTLAEELLPQVVGELKQ
jgi:acyl-CoA thioesterase-1